MKTYRNLYPQVCSFENLYLAYRAARRGKRTHVGVAAFEYDQERELLQLRDELQARTWRPGPYHSFYIHDPANFNNNIGFRLVGSHVFGLRPEARVVSATAAEA